MSILLPTTRLLTGFPALLLLAAICPAADTVPPPLAVFTKYCGDCHTNGEMEGSLALDQLLAAADWKTDRPKWASVWKNLRTQLMPPADQPQPSADEKRLMLSWIEDRIFQLNPEHPDPGRVTIRRLNR
ncbi:MAG: c-type cytochrome domain-containing protein, partial [Planctomycetaceae bacterium]|nr:c-type cytochrome domain-containing protein [Planctomycetaceae bacterium]